VLIVLGIRGKIVLGIRGKKIKAQSTRQCGTQQARDTEENKKRKNKFDKKNKNEDLRRVARVTVFFLIRPIANRAPRPVPATPIPRRAVQNPVGNLPPPGFGPLGAASRGSRPPMLG
jgi:hypothetical protein